MPNDSPRCQRGKHTDRARGSTLLVLVALALWLPLLVVFPMWLIGGLVATLLAGCAVSALLPLLSESGAEGSSVRIVGLTHGSS